jgi:nucleoside 2-deoxyribosyltransferase
LKIYLAGPLFTTAERDFNAALAALLRDRGHEVFLPQEHEQRDVTARAIFESDVAGIEWCDVLVACMDGPDPDSGTSWECGSVAGRKPVILFRTDIREEAFRPLQSDAASGGAAGDRLQMALCFRDRGAHQ